jgi:hypothetical protein
MSAPSAFAQQAVTPGADGTFVPSASAPGMPPGARPGMPPGGVQPGMPPGNAATLGQRAPQPPTYVVGTGGYQVPPTVVAPSYGAYVQSPAAGFLNGAAALTSASGQYLNDVQNARITREQSRQAEMDTAKKRVEFEQWYETVRPTAPKMVAQEKATDLNWARNYAQNTEIWSGRTLNVLYESAIRSRYMFQGPNIPVDEKFLRGLNVQEKSERGNGGLLKDQKLYWTETLDSEAYDRNRDEFSQNWVLAQKQLAKGDPIERTTLRDLEASLGKLQAQLDGSVDSLPPSRWIESNRYLKQLKEGVTALQRTRRGMPASYTLLGHARNVAEICAYMAKNGLQFAAAAANEDYPAYSAFYLLLRSFEMSVSGGP